MLLGHDRLSLLSCLGFRFCVNSASLSFSSSEHVKGDALSVGEKCDREKLEGESPDTMSCGDTVRIRENDFSVESVLKLILHNIFC